MTFDAQEGKLYVYVRNVLEFNHLQDLPCNKTEPHNRVIYSRIDKEFNVHTNLAPTSILFKVTLIKAIAEAIEYYTGIRNQCKDLYEPESEWVMYDDVVGELFEMDQAFLKY